MELLLYRSMILAFFFMFTINCVVLFLLYKLMEATRQERKDMLNRIMANNVKEVVMLDNASDELPSYRPGSGESFIQKARKRQAQLDRDTIESMKD